MIDYAETLVKMSHAVKEYRLSMLNNKIDNAKLLCDVIERCAAELTIYTYGQDD